MRKLSLGQIAAITGGQLRGNAQIVVSGVSTDSRTVQPGDIFAAIVGERVDAHDKVNEALERGAVAVLATRPVAAPSVIVEKADDLDAVIIALGQLARKQRELRGSTAVVAVTGSSGKTSTKDIIGQVLAVHAPTYAPPGNPNNELGLPMTILDAPDDARFIVTEMGMRGVGHIAYLCGIAGPTIGVVTNVGLAHVSEVGSLEAIGRAKAELVAALPSTGVAVLNNDDDIVREMRFDTSAHVITYGLREGSDVRAEHVSAAIDGTSVFDLVHGADRHVITLPLPGLHNVSNALAGAALGIAVGMNLREVAEALERLVLQSKWRMQTTHLDRGITVINDAYNANPDSMAAGLRTLAAFPRPRWAVLGGMHELGEHSEREHTAIGQLCAELGIDHVVTVGHESDAIAVGARQGRHVVSFADFDKATNYIMARVEDDAVLFFKASRAQRFEILADMVSQAVGSGDS